MKYYPGACCTVDLMRSGWEEMLYAVKTHTQNLTNENIRTSQKYQTNSFPPSGRCLGIFIVCFNTKVFEELHSQHLSSSVGSKLQSTEDI